MTRIFTIESIDDIRTAFAGKDWQHASLMREGRVFVSITRPRYDGKDGLERRYYSVYEPGSLAATRTTCPITATMRAFRAQSVK